MNILEIEMAREGLAKKTDVPTVGLVSIGNCGPSNGGFSYLFPVKGGVVSPGGVIEFKANIQRFTRSTGNIFQIKLKQGNNEVVVSQSYFTATVGHAQILSRFVISSDGKFGLSTTGFGINAGSGASPGNDAFYSGEIFRTNNQSASTNSRDRGNIKFSTFSNHPTIETTLIDFSNDFTINISLSNGANDISELWGFSVYYEKTTALNLAAISCYGDSLTEGAGSTSYNDYPSIIRYLNQGVSVINQGLGGQTMPSIISRLLSDQLAKYGRLVLWAGINDASSDGEDWWGIVKSGIDSSIAYRGKSPDLIIPNFHIKQDWSQQYKDAAIYVNSKIAETFPSMVVDIFGSISPGGVPNASYYSDSIHLNNAGYLVVANLIKSKSDSFGWT